MEEPRIWVVGSANIDLVVRAPRHPAPGETLLGTDLAIHTGGKGANQAVAAARMGAPVTFLGAVGRDPYGDRLLDALASEGIDVASVARAERPTGTAMIVVADGENTIVVSPGANEALDRAALEALNPSPSDIVVVQLEIPIETARAAVATGARAGATTILNAAPAVTGAQDMSPDVLVLNATELATLSGRTVADGDPTEAIASAMTSIGATVVTTLGSRGVLALDGGRIIEVPAQPVHAVDTTGAGDCFVGALAAEMLNGRDLTASLWVATAAAGLCVQRPGAGSAMPTRDEVEAILG